MPTKSKRPRTKAQREADAKRRGRPTVPAHLRREDNRVTVYFTAPEYRAFKRCVEASGKSMARFLVDTWREASGFRDRGEDWMPEDRMVTQAGTMEIVPDEEGGYRFDIEFGRYNVTLNESVATATKALREGKKVAREFGIKLVTIDDLSRSLPEYPEDQG